MTDTAANRTHRAARRRAERDGRKQEHAPGVESGRGWRDHAWEWFKAIAWALGVALIIRQFFFQAFTIPTGSMKDTLLVHDFLFVNKLVYGAKTPDRLVIPFWKKTLIDDIPHFRLPGFREPAQGDIIVFEYPLDRNQDYIKRCVAIAGDTVEVRDGTLYVNDTVYESNFADRDGDHSCVPMDVALGSCPEPHTRRERASFLAGRYNRQFGPYVVPEDHIFMMGDNRYNSHDSRYWGPVNVDFIKGKAEIIYWSYEHTFFVPRFGRLLKLIDLHPDRGWLQPTVRIGVVLVIIGVVLYYRRRDRNEKEAPVQE